MEGEGPEQESFSPRKEALRDVKLRVKAAHLAIPQESLAHPTVRELLGVLGSVEDLQAGITEAQKWEETERLPTPETPTLRRCYRAADWLVGGARAILAEGFRGAPVNPAHFGQDVLDLYINGYPVEWTGKLNQWKKGAAPEPSVGLWRMQEGKPVAIELPEAVGKQDVHEWLKRASVLEWRSEEHEKRVLEAASSLGVDEGVLATDPATRLPIDPSRRALVVNFVDAQDVARRCARDSSLPSAPGLEPSAQARLARAGHLSRAVTMVLGEGLGGHTVTAKDLAYELNGAMVTYGIKFDPRPEGPPRRGRG